MDSRWPVSIYIPVEELTPHLYANQVPQLFQRQPLYNGHVKNKAGKKEEKHYYEYYINIIFIVII